MTSASFNKVSEFQTWEQKQLITSPGGAPSTNAETVASREAIVGQWRCLDFARLLLKLRSGPQRVDSGISGPDEAEASSPRNWYTWLNPFSIFGGTGFSEVKHGEGCVEIRGVGLLIPRQFFECFASRSHWKVRYDIDDARVFGGLLLYHFTVYFWTKMVWSVSTSSSYLESIHELIEHKNRRSLPCSLWIAQHPNHPHKQALATFKMHRNHISAVRQPLAW